MNIQTISRDLWLLTNFRNGWDMVKYLRNPKPISKAILYNGQTILHPPNLGLVESLIELWRTKIYFPKGFYSPSANDIVIDLGANIGLFTLQVANINPECKVYAFEPMPENYSCLKQNVDNFNLSNVSTYQYAISDEYSQGLITKVTDRSLDNQLIKIRSIQDENTTGFNVDYIPLEAIFDIVKSLEISLLKIDIEGGEQDIFKSTPSAVWKGINSLAIEYHDNLRPGTLRLITEKLKKTHNLKTFNNDISECGLLFATLR